MRDRTVLCGRTGIEFKIYRPLAVMRAVAVAYFKLMDRLRGNSHGLIERMYALPPHLECALPFRGTYKIFDFHLLEFARTENEIARSNLVAECFSYLRDAEGQLGVKGVDDILEIGKNSPGGLGA